LIGGAVFVWQGEEGCEVAVDDQVCAALAVRAGGDIDLVDQALQQCAGLGADGFVGVGVAVEISDGAAVVFCHGGVNHQVWQWPCFEI